MYNQPCLCDALYKLAKEDSTRTPPPLSSARRLFELINLRREPSECESENENNQTQTRPGLNDNSLSQEQRRYILNSQQPDSAGAEQAAAAVGF